MDETILIKLLQLHNEHQRKIREFAGKINLNYFEIDLLALVLDAIGVPADNSIEQSRWGVCPVRAEVLEATAIL